MRVKRNEPRRNSFKTYNKHQINCKLNTFKMVKLDVWFFGFWVFFLFRDILFHFQKEFAFKQNKEQFLKCLTHASTLQANIKQMDIFAIFLECLLCMDIHNVLVIKFAVFSFLYSFSSHQLKKKNTHSHWHSCVLQKKQNTIKHMCQTLFYKNLRAQIQP